MTNTPCHEIHDPWPSIYWKCFELALLFHLKAINWAISKPWGDSTIQLWEQRHSGKISLHIESASLCPWKFELLVQLPSSSFFVMENLIESFIWACLWWRPSWRDLVSWFRYVSLQKFFTYVLLLIILIEILFSCPIGILQIFELLFHGRICHVC